jgi:glucose-6-phosphate isomerase
MQKSDLETLKSLADSAPTINALFAADPQRFATFSARFGDMLLDYSKTTITPAARDALLALTAPALARRDAMFAGAPINATEKRAVLHTALRAPAGTTLTLDGADIIAPIHETLDRLYAFARAIRSGAHKGATGEKITDVVNIGIGGSDLGPAMVTRALSPFHDGPRTHFVANVDAADLADTLRTLDPATTLFIIASKTFTTVETMTNAASARAWLTAALGEAAVAAHFAAVSTALPKVGSFGIAPDKIFGFWDWVGGRYSVWSAIGLPVIIAIGPENFAQFLAGAHAMDEHFRTTPAAENLPILLALTGIWHRNACGFAARAVLPYDQRLARLPAYLQQLDMESNGKSVQLDGSPATTATGPLVFGEPGTNGQHAFYQLIHQGTDIIPCEFLIAAQGFEPDMQVHHNLLIANCLAQSLALAQGRSLAEATQKNPASLAPHKVFPGNRPSITIAYRQLTPHTLGQLIALYEHRVFTEAAIWNINAFDQWGVELGKELATNLLPAVEGAPPPADPSTAGLIAHLGALKT